MATWEVSVFDSKTEQLIDEFKVYGIDPSQVSAIWQLPPGVPPSGDQLITAHEIDRLNELLDRPLSLKAGEELFLGLHRDYPGEAIVEANGERWYPAPGIEAPL